ncbi:MAG: DNA polymerase III subunit beta [Lachnospiraceae bacterium]|nr:DNA polymerase III subunit beta [Lachnospiraceae bacterium]
MKIVCPQEELSKGVNIVSKAVPSKSPMSILECILIDASSGSIRLIANDMEIGIETVINGRIENPGIVALDAGVFTDLVRKLPSGDVTIDIDSNFKASIKCGKVKLDILGRSGEEFSYLPRIERNDKVIISQFSLREIIRQTIFSTADNDNNKVMCGELFHVRGNKLRVVALDGHRIAVREIELKESYDEKKVIVPKKALNEISKIINGSIDDIVDIYLSKNHILFEFENTKMVSRLFEGDFFEVDQMISANYETRIKISNKELHSSIDRSTLLIKEGEKKPIIMDIKDNVINMKMSSIIGNMDEDIEIVKEGKDLVIGFNPKFIMDALRVVDDEEIYVYFVNSKSPCFIKNENNSYVYMILPVNVNVG